jgi:large subunit ribosomal protein L19e
MGIKLTKRIAADLMDRGVSSIRISQNATQEAKKAITRDDVRALIKNGSVYALAEKKVLSLHGKELHKKRVQGRRRGPGKKKGSQKARKEIEYKKVVRGQRRVLGALKDENIIDNEMFKKFYSLVKGGSFQNKASLINHIKDEGISISAEKLAELKKL